MNDETPDNSPPTPAPPTLPDPSSYPADGPPPGAVIAQLELARVGRILRYWPPNTFRRKDAPPEEAPISVWCVAIDTGDVLVWDAERFTVLSEAETTVLGGAVAGLGALFKGVVGKAKASGIPFGRLLELLALALAMQGRALQQSADSAAKKTEALQYARAQAVPVRPLD